MVPTKAALRVMPKQGVVRLFIPKPGMTSTRVLSPERRFELETGA